MPFKETTTTPSPPAQSEPSRITTRFDRARSPTNCVCEADAIHERQTRGLQTIRHQLNRGQFRRETRQYPDHVFCLSAAFPDVTKNIYETLFTPRHSQDREGIPVA
jgi:hypothetical protein